MLQSRHRWFCWLSTVALTLIASAVDAQPSRRPYVGATLGGTLVDADIATGTVPSSGFIVGTRVTPRWDIEGTVTFPTHGVSRAYGGADDSPSIWVSPAGTVPESRDLYAIWIRYRNAREIHVVTSGAAIFRMTVPRAPRVSVGLVAGLSAQRVTDVRERTVVRVGSGVPESHPSARDSAETFRRTIGGPMVGVQLAIDVTRHLTVAPDIRLHYGSIGDEINNLVQPTIRAVWRSP